MPDDRQRDALRVFEGSLAYDGEARAAYLDDACRADPALRCAVESLLAQQSDAEAFLERPAVDGAPAQAALAAPVAPPREPLSRGTVLCDSRGITSSDYALFRFRRIRRPIHPLDPT